MGGIIIRACLPYLQLYKNSFHCYISLCTPHMGYLYHTSKIVTTSIWLMNQLKKDQSMIELTLSDDPELDVRCGGSIENIFVSAVRRQIAFLVQKRCFRRIKRGRICAFQLSHAPKYGVFLRI